MIGILSNSSLEKSIFENKLQGSKWSYNLLESALLKKIQGLSQVGKSIQEYMEEFYWVLIRTNHAEANKEKVACCLNGLRPSIQDCWAIFMHDAKWQEFFQTPLLKSQSCELNLRF